MNIYSCVDNKNIDKIFVLFFSCYVNCSDKENLNFYLLVENEFNLEDLKIPEFLKDKITIRNLDMEKLKSSGWISLIKKFSDVFYIQGMKCNHIMNFARFFVFSHFPEIDRFIYLDWDMIVDGDICQLNDEYNSKKLVVANPYKIEFSKLVGNIGNLNLNQLKLVTVNKNFIKSNLHKLQRDLIFKNYNELLKILTGKDNIGKNKSFNAGFYIVSKETFDEQYLKNIISKLINIQKEKKCFRFGTQVIMNLISVNNMIFVDKKWNNIPNDDNFISHWNGLEKPWISKDKKWMKYFNKLNNEQETCIVNS